MTKFELLLDSNLDQVLGGWLSSCKKRVRHVKHPKCFLGELRNKSSIASGFDSGFTSTVTLSNNSSSISNATATGGSVTSPLGLTFFGTNTSSKDSNSGNNS